jgi:hypothetical protein
LIPYMQKILSDFLRDALAGPRVVSDPPPEDRRDTAWIQVIQTPEATHNLNDPADRLIEFYFQLSCYAGRDGGQPESDRLCRDALAALKEMPGQHGAPKEGETACVVSAAKPLTGPGFFPDSDGFEPARARSIASTIIYAHAVS